MISTACRRNVNEEDDDRTKWLTKEDGKHHSQFIVVGILYSEDFQKVLYSYAKYSFCKKTTTTTLLLCYDRMVARNLIFVVVVASSDKPLL